MLRGPSDTRKPNRHHTQIVHRYIYDGQQVAQRETYRNHRIVTETKPGTVYPRYDGKYWLTDYTQPEVTRFVPTLHGNSSGMVYCDSDGTMDVSINDGLGQPWYMYRAREGARQFATPDHQKGQNTGILKPMALPTGCEHLSFKPWQLHAIEPDILMGRRGVLGWDGERYSSGLLINGPIVNPPELGLWERSHLMWERDPLQTIGYVTIGTAAVVAGVVVTIGTGGLAGFAIGGAMTGFGMGFGVTGAATHNANAAMQAGAIGAVAGAVGGAASFGAAGLFGGVAAIGGMSLGGQIVAGATMGAAGGFAGGFTGGTIGGLAAGQSGWDALQSGWKAGKTGAMWGAAMGAGVPVAIRGVQLAGRGTAAIGRAIRSRSSLWYRPDGRPYSTTWGATRARLNRAAGSTRTPKVVDPRTGAQVEGTRHHGVMARRHARRLAAFARRLGLEGVARRIERLAHGNTKLMSRYEHARVDPNYYVEGVKTIPWYFAPARTWYGLTPPQRFAGTVAATAVAYGSCKLGDWLADLVFDD